MPRLHAGHFTRSPFPVGSRGRQSLCQYRRLQPTASAHHFEISSRRGTGLNWKIKIVQHHPSVNVRYGWGSFVFFFYRHGTTGISFVLFSLSNLVSIICSFCLNPRTKRKWRICNISKRGVSYKFSPSTMTFYSFLGSKFHWVFEIDLVIYSCLHCCYCFCQICTGTWFYYKFNMAFFFIFVVWQNSR